MSFHDGELTEEEWLHDLRTTKAHQATGVLRDGAGGYCCLGRACVKDKRIKPGSLPGAHVYFIPDKTSRFSTQLPISAATMTAPTVGSVLSWMTPNQARLCTIANDSVGMSFRQIADWWEAGRPLDEGGFPTPVEPKGS